MSYLGVAVWPLVLGALGACITQPGGSPGGGGWGSGPGGGGGTSGYYCELDKDCTGGDVCARDGECLPPNEVRVVHVGWTLRGQAASTASCANAPNLDITFYDGNLATGSSFGFSPVPCVEGRFTVDKLPTFYPTVGLERAGDYNGGVTTVFDTTGNAALDLKY